MMNWSIQRLKRLSRSSLNSQPPTILPVIRTRCRRATSQSIFFESTFSLISMDVQSYQTRKANCENSEISHIPRRNSWTVQTKSSRSNERHAHTAREIGAAARRSHGIALVGLPPSIACFHRAGPAMTVRAGRKNPSRSSLMLLWKESKKMNRPMLPWRQS